MLLLAILAIGFAMPVYPSTKSICDMFAERNPLDRFSSLDRGALVTVSGMLYSGMPGVYELRVTCRRDTPSVALEVPRFALAGPDTRRALRSLTRERGVPVRAVVRVESEIFNDFGYPMILRAWAITASKDRP
ncbi:MAG TPA: hypothetical protein VN605_05680 [Thermoanaerobaculia bacterium]|nr:hypothetical protein [Thermoanaerobaculia bacterium]